MNVLDFVVKDQKGNDVSLSRFSTQSRHREEPGRDSPQRRALYCASLFSLGALCTGMILLRIDSGSRSLLCERAIQTLGSISLVPRLSVFFAFPFVLLLLGTVPLGPAFLSALDVLFGAASFLVFSSFLFSGGSPLTALLLIPTLFSAVYLSASVLHLSGMLFRQLISGGRFRPDLRPIFLRIIVFALLFELTMFFFWNLF